MLAMGGKAAPATLAPMALIFAVYTQPNRGNMHQAQPARCFEMHDMDIEKVAKAIEDDAGEAIDDLRQALTEAKTSMGRVTTPEQLANRQSPHRPKPH